MTARPRVALIQTGGTIDSVGASRLDLAWYYETGERLPDGGLVASVPESGEFAAVEEKPFRRLSSSALTTRDWLGLARTVEALLAGDDYAGVVLTHGTNTLEETAYFLHLVLRSPKPVVLVGAIRPPSALSPDGPLNLLRAIQVAASPQARGHGVLVVANDTIHSARDVTKTAPFRVQAFQAPDLGPLGYADADGRVVFYHRHLRAGPDRPGFDLAGLDDLPRVDVVASYVGADGALVDAAVAAGARGIVSAGTGGGRPTPAEDAALDRAAAAGVVVCQSSRVGSGRIPPSPSLRARGAVAADSLQPWKAKVLLSLALTRTTDPDVVQDLFDRL
ncbi:asparaginase [Streptomyces sp. NPDC093250]|uniref:asparaginase n=1 Tax=Streptomyces sp. NPDC093250 TaxID=3366036 RepID=UPI00382470B0